MLVLVGWLGAGCDGKITITTAASVLAASNVAGGESSAGEEKAESRTLVRMLWIRHGLSCANVLDKCVTAPEALPNVTTQLRRSLTKTLRGAKLEGGRAAIDWEWGIQPRGWVDAREETTTDCALKLKDLAPWQSDTARVEGALGIDGDVIRLHDLYQDPSLTVLFIIFF